MQWFELVGYIASALVVLTFTMNDMRSLRVAAVSSNVAFLAYGFSLDLGPVVSLHAILLPLNLWRLARSRSNARDIVARIGAAIRCRASIGGRSPR